jgi:Fe-S cluster assembly iron-binding protein IscA
MQTTTAQATSAAPEAIEPAVTFTDSALRQIRRVLARRKQAEPNIFLRVGVKGGGC